MNKRCYIAPVVEIMAMDGKDALLLVTSVNGNGMRYGGSASENHIYEADINDRGDWEIW